MGIPYTVLYSIAITQVLQLPTLCTLTNLDFGQFGRTESSRCSYFLSVGLGPNVRSMQL